VSSTNYPVVGFPDGTKGEVKPERYAYLGEAWLIHDDPNVALIAINDPNGKPLISIWPDRVEIAEGHTMEEGAQKFWECIDRLLKAES
jgi:hypothetical protein